MGCSPPPGDKLQGELEELRTLIVREEALLWPRMGGSSAQQNLEASSEPGPAFLWAAY